MYTDLQTHQDKGHQLVLLTAAQHHVHDHALSLASCILKAMVEQPKVGCAVQRYIIIFCRSNMSNVLPGTLSAAVPLTLTEPM